MTKSGWIAARSVSRSRRANAEYTSRMTSRSERLTGFSLLVFTTGSVRMRRERGHRPWTSLTHFVVCEA